MNCSEAQENIGPYVDGELDVPLATELQAHLDSCPGCATELESTRGMVLRLKAECAPCCVAPAACWAVLGHQLDRLGSTPAVEAPVLKIESSLSYGKRRSSVVRLLRKPLAAAASFALFAGLATTVVIWTNRTEQTVQAASVDYSVLLDGLGGNVDAAVDRFIAHYAGERIAAENAPVVAPRLNFALPQELPGGYRREGVYRLHFGSMDGVAARYRRDGEPLIVFFHSPIGPTRLGMHRESQCHVAGREGQRVEVGPWQLVHFTDPTTCHCLLSKIADEASQSAIFAAIAPKFQ